MMIILKVTCRECMWRGVHRGHASEDASEAGKRAIVQLTSASRNAKTLLNSLLTKYNEKVFFSNIINRSHTIHGTKDDKKSFFYNRSRSLMSSHSREAKERIQEYSRLKRARYLIGEAIIICGNIINIED